MRERSRMLVMHLSWSIVIIKLRSRDQFQLKFSQGLVDKAT
ncbi:MAG TPA: hypothetical protein V6D09_05665 [Leptolyngbyaceae cyanobacterium]